MQKTEAVPARSSYPSDAEVAAAVADVLSAIVPPLAEALRGKQPQLRLIAHAVNDSATRAALAGPVGLATIVAHQLTLNTVFLDVHTHALPPAVGVGSGGKEIDVGPTIGGTDNPDAKASVGVSVKVNPSGASGYPSADVSGGVDVDGEGKVKGFSFGLKCSF